MPGTPVKITVTLPDGARRAAVGSAGESLMQAMRDSGLPVMAACGGAMACATCHVHVAPEWMCRVGSAGAEESDLLDGSDYRSATSRLGCQVSLTPALDGLEVALQLDALEG